VIAATARFLRADGRWLAAGLAMTFASSAGQTFFIALFADPLRAATGLGHGGWGALYAAATLASALAIAAVGHVADRRPMAVPAVGVLGLAAVGAVAMSAVTSPWLLALALTLLRFAGQGMASHVAMTAAARWFRVTRGRALAVVSLGHPLGEAVLPGLVVAATAGFGWRSTWLAVALGLAGVLAPLVAHLGAVERTPHRRAEQSADDEAAPTGLDGRHWARRDVLRHPVFWALLPGVLASPFMVTALLFQAAPLMAAKGWSLQVYATAFPAYAAASVAGGLVSGLLVDRFGPIRLVPFVLLPLAAGLALAATAPAPLAAFAFLALIGLNTGAVFTLIAALFAELYGTRHLGAVRGLVSSFTVFGTALAPGVTGLLLDAGVALEAQLAAMAVVAVGLAGMLALVARHLLARAPAPA
jgi:MFS family permease